MVVRICGTKNRSKIKTAIIWCLLLLSAAALQAQNTIHTIDKAGAWCWFSDPRAIYLHGKKTGVLTGWVKMDGSIETALIDPISGAIQSELLYDKLEIDDHDNPAFLEVSDQQYMAFYAKHSRNEFYYHQSASEQNRLFGAPIAFDPISEEELAKFPRRQITYANPFVLAAENNRIYCFGRWTGFKPNVMFSDDGGQTFGQSQVFIAEEGFRDGNRPYVKYYSDGQSKIHFIFTDGHPRNEPTNSVYYAYYESGSFWRVDGTKICDFDQLPIRPKDATLVYKATKESGRAWVHDVVADKNGNPTILYTRYPTEKDHYYHYAQFNGKKWFDYEICHSGGWFPQTMEGKTEKEPHYSGGLILHPTKLNTVYLSREVNGVFEIERWIAKKHGKRWKSSAITSNSKYDNVRPYIPRNMQKGDQSLLLWMENEKYVHYTDYSTNIKFTLD